MKPPFPPSFLLLPLLLIYVVFLAVVVVVAWWWWYSCLVIEYILLTSRGARPTLPPIGTRLAEKKCAVLPY